MHARHELREVRDAPLHRERLLRAGRPARARRARRIRSGSTFATARMPPAAPATTAGYTTGAQPENTGKAPIRSVTHCPRRSRSGLVSFMPAMFGCSASAATIGTSAPRRSARQVVRSTGTGERVRHAPKVRDERVGRHLGLEVRGRPHEHRVCAQRGGALAASIVARVDSRPTPTSSTLCPARPAHGRTTVSPSPSSSRPASPFEPSASTPARPVAMSRRRWRRSRAASTSPLESNIVGSGGKTPESARVHT